MTTKTLVFDFDGTLVDSNAIKHDTFFDVTDEEPEARAHLEAILSAPHGDRYDVFRTLAGLLHQDRDWASDKAQQYTLRCEELISKAPEILGASETLNTLSRQGHSLHVNSATPQATLIPIVQDRGWGGLFQTILGAPQTKEENLQDIMSRFDVDASDMIMIGDGENDQQAALTMGIAFIAIATPRQNFSVPPEVWSENMSNLVNLV